jgi:hypothetical protein
MRDRTGILVVVAIVVAACAHVPPSAAPSVRAGLTEPTTLTTSSPVPTAVPIPSLDPEVAQAVRFRHDFGLRSDLPFVIASLTDPRATDLNFGVPLYPEEAAKLFADQADQDAAIPIVVGYGMGHPDEYAGVYIDREEHPGLVVALWTAHLDQHATTLAGLLGGHAIVVRQVRYPYAELDALKERVFADIDWMEAIPARATSIGVGVSANSVQLDVSSADPTAVQQIEAHYDLGDRLVVTSDKTGAELVPWGDVKGIVRTPGGRAPGANDLFVDYEYRADQPGGCNDGVGHGVLANGQFEINCQAGVRTILIMGRAAKGGNEVVGRATVIVIAGQTVHVTIRLTRNP